MAVFCLTLLYLFSFQTSSAHAEERTFTYIDKVKLGVSCDSTYSITENKDADGSIDALCVFSNAPIRDEIYCGNAKEDYDSDIINLKDAGEDEITSFADTLVERTHEYGGTVTREATVEQETVNGIPYVILMYSVNAYGNKIISLDYTTVIDGTVIMVCNYALDAGSEEKNQSSYDGFRQFMTQVFYGTEEETKKMADECFSKETSEPALEQEVSETTTSFWETMNQAEIPTWIWLIIPAVILIAFAKLKRPNEWHEDFMSLPVSKGILGVCALFIVLHHISQPLSEDAGALSALEEIGVGFVGLFFVFSGYGLFKSLKQKEDYLKGYFKKRYVSILIPFFLINTIFFLYTWLVIKEPMTTKDIICYLTGYVLLNTHMWYIIEIALFYLAFYLVFRFVKNDLAGLLVMTGFVAVFTVVSLMLCHGPFWFQGEWWFNTSAVFVLGMFFAKYEEKLVSFAKKTYPVLLPVCVAATAGLYVLTSHLLEKYSYYSEYYYGNNAESFKDKFMCLGAQLPMVMFFVISVLLITMKVQFKNKVLTFLGNISLELYLIHNLFLMIFTNVVKVTSPFLFTTFVVISAVIAATILHYIHAKLIHFIVKK